MQVSFPKFGGIFIICFFALMFSATSTFANTPGWDSLRDLQPVLIRGNDLFEFLNSPVDDLFMYRYDETLDAWEQIPFQVDELDDTTSYWGPKDGLLSGNDEILFMAKDKGDRATANNWIGDQQSRQNLRYELKITDPLDPAKEGWVYVYRSSTLARDPNVEDYISYIPDPGGAGADTIRALSYVEGHNINGIPDYWTIPQSVGGNGQDILDRQKARVTLYYGFFTMTEDALTNPIIQSIDGPIRILRNITYDLFGLTTLNMTTYYLPYSIDSQGASGTLPPDYGVTLIRQSFDLNPNAIGMTLYNPYNPSGVPINGQPDSPNTTLVDSPALNWYLITGSQGSIVTLFELSAIGTNRSLYYWDNTDGSTDDGTVDTGDMQSYGDTGILIQGTNIAGSFSMAYLTYFMGANQSSSVGDTLADYYENPLSVSFQPNTYAPVMVSIPDSSGMSGTPISIPIRITDVTGLGIYSWGDTLTYNPQVLEATGVSVTGTIVQSWGTPTINIQPGEISMAQAGFTALSGSGVLVYVNFNIIGADRDTTTIHFKQVQFNEGDPQAVSKDGLFTIIGVIPVELASFSATNENGNVVLNWSTATETNNYGFEIQRKSELEGNDEWEKRGFIEGHGTTTQPHTYTFIDKEVPAGRYYYRLKQVDTDGSVEYSHVLQVTIGTPENFALRQNYPNPFNPETMISYQISDLNGQAIPVTLKVFDLLGNEVRTLVNTKQKAGYYTVQWDGRNSWGQKVAAGVYVYQLCAGHFVETRKMILLK